MDRVRCFMLERTERAQISFRRYSESIRGSCPFRPGQYSYHNVSIIVEPDVEYLAPYEGQGDIPSAEQRRDARWPAACECGYVFAPDDHWYINYDRLYRLPDGTLIEPEKAPAGAMWFAHWYEDVKEYVGPDGRALMVMCPPGGSSTDLWHVDGPARDGGRWTRFGAPPDVTASPSILTPRYHGFLRGGYLEKC